MKTGSQRETEASNVAGSGVSEVQTGTNEVDVSQAADSQQGGSPFDAASEMVNNALEQMRNGIEAVSGQFGQQENTNNRSDRFQAMADAQSNADKRFLEALRSGDQETLVKLTSNKNVLDAPSYEGYKPVNGFNHIVRDNRGYFHPANGELTPEAISELEKIREEWLGGHMQDDTKWQILKDVDKYYMPIMADDYAPRSQQQAESGGKWKPVAPPSAGQQAKSGEKWTPVTPPPAGSQQQGQPQGQQQTQQQSQQQAPPQSQQQPQQPLQQQPEKPEREQIDEYWADYESARRSKAQQANDRNYAAWRQDNPDAPEREYYDWEYYAEDPEALEKMLGSLMREHYSSLGETIKNAEGENVQRPSQGAGIKFEERERLDRLIDRVTRAFRIGFFHLSTERLDKDKAGNIKGVRWSRPVEDRIIRLCDYFGMDPNLVDSQRTIFRLVILYASMGIDTHGRMFNEGKDEWALSEREFTDICDMIYRSCIERGHPMAAPFNTSSGRAALRGTDVIPSGVMPKVVAKAITGENSMLGMTTDQLVDACRMEWVTKTYPWVKANLVNHPQRGPKRRNKDGEEIKERNLEAQRISIEYMQQALARLDGMDAPMFSSHYGVDTTPHYKIQEYMDTDIDYATAMNGLYDADAVVEYQRAQLDRTEEDMHRHRDKREISGVAAAANIVTSGIKTNALFWQVPIAVAAIGEKAVGDVQTDFTIRRISKSTARNGGEPRMQVSKAMKDSFRTDEGHKAIDAALILMDVAGTPGLALFSKTGMPMTQDNVMKFLHDEYLPRAANENAARAQWLSEKLSRIQHKLLTGDIAFKNYDAMNFLNALLTSNQVLADVQAERALQGMSLDKVGGLALTGEELDDVLKAHHGDVSRFLAEVLGTPAGRDALIMMRSNNIGNFNPVGFRVDQALRDHAVTNAMVTTFFDTFPKYSINFLYTVTPFSRSLSYLAMKKREMDGDVTSGMFVMGGGLSDASQYESIREAYRNDPGFRAGLRMNLIYDGVTIGRWAVTAMILGGVFAILGFEPPDHDEDIINSSMWKIGGEEIQLAYWLNDLTQLGLPAAYGLAAVLSGYGEHAATIALDSLYNQVDGNVVFDFIKGVKGWGHDLDELMHMQEDPSYQGDIDLSYGVMELILSAADKIVPGAPLYRAIGKDAFLRGENAREADPSKLFDKSSDWAKEVGKKDYNPDARDRQIRRHATSDWLLAALMDMANFDPETGTGYFWWEMPAKGTPDDLVMVWSALQNFDIKGDLEGCETVDGYKQVKADQLLKQIDQVIEDYGSIEQAVLNGYAITHDIRYNTLEVLSDRLNDIDTEFQAKVDSGELAGSDFYTAKAEKDAEVNRIWDYLHILQGNTSVKVPEWFDGYEQLITDRDVSYVHLDGSPAQPWEALFSTDITPVYNLKGNHPTSLMPFPVTLVDTRDTETVERGYGGETVPFWYDEDTTDLDAIRQGVGRNVIRTGANKGYILNDQLFGFDDSVDFRVPTDENGDFNEDALKVADIVAKVMDDTGSYLHPDEPTIGRRAFVPIKQTISDDIKNYDVSGKAKAATEATENDDGTTKGTASKTAYPKSVYGYGTKAGSGNYNPKIYSTARSINPDRAATMYSKQLSDARTNYLSPGFSTKGSREAYRRQDI